MRKCILIFVLLLGQACVLLLAVPHAVATSGNGHGSKMMAALVRHSLMVAEGHSIRADVPAIAPAAFGNGSHFALTSIQKKAVCFVKKLEIVQAQQNNPALINWLSEEFQRTYGWDARSVKDILTSSMLLCRQDTPKLMGNLPQ